MSWALKHDARGPVLRSDANALDEARIEDDDSGGYDLVVEVETMEGSETLRISLDGIGRLAAAQSANLDVEAVVGPARTTLVEHVRRREAASASRAHVGRGENPRAPRCLARSRTQTWLDVMAAPDAKPADYEVSMSAPQVEVSIPWSERTHPSIPIAGIPARPCTCGDWPQLDFEGPYEGAFVRCKTNVTDPVRGACQPGRWGRTPKAAVRSWNYRIGRRGPP